ncbi:HDOD domain-containing protein [Porticoccus sp. W117]|uniref:HDOD domain-containing protein n=1 Tax=Porticoccus sp. W117 TaxID=3054777 RepID=UPI0025966C45|nr:HDOD domain-containing protein [Porticoccus sp. W117]MDM3871722.1 HDOD domain-containing protein [Porticoccus sp. W117]
MKRIAFVDDDKNVLDGLRRMLRCNRKEWKMNFYLSGDELLSELDDNSFDIIVSDMRMPHMNGGELLSRVKELSPSTLRIVLSGYANEEMILESLHATHQFISKPADSDKITKSINRALHLQESLEESGIKEFVGSIDALPTLPAIYDELMRETCSDDSSLERVGEIIARDVALSANILKIVNSAFFALVRHIESPSQAASILGMDTLKNLALSTSVFSSFKSDQGSIEEIERLNMATQRVGVLCGKLGKESSLSARAIDHGQIAGMMCNLGELIVRVYPSEMAAWSGGQPSLSHVGSYLLGIWAMPFPVVEAVRWHRCPADSQIDELSPLAVLHFAWALLSAHADGEEIDLENDKLDTDYLNTVIGAETLQRWLRVTEEFCDQVDS